MPFFQKPLTNDRRNVSFIPVSRHIHGNEGSRNRVDVPLPWLHAVIFLSIRCVRLVSSQTAQK